MTAFEHASDIDFIRAKIQELMEDLGPEAVTELAQSFIDETPDTLSKLQKYTVSNDFQKLRRAAHSFKSIAQIYGFEEVGNLAGRIEQASLNEKISEVPSLLLKMEKFYQAGIEYLKQHLSSQHQIVLKIPG
jgi:HPt (histidine-containing phosphotransfer) domain-containing protein